MLNGSNIAQSDAPPFKSSESVARDVFSTCFDNGFETRTQKKNLGSAGELQNRAATTTNGNFGMVLGEAHLSTDQSLSRTVRTWCDVALIWGCFYIDKACKKKLAPESGAFFSDAFI